MSANISIMFAYIIGIILLFILGRILLLPMKIILRLIYNAIIGGIILLIINFFGGFFNFHIAFNIFTALIVGFLGIPGVILLIILKLIFNT